MLKFCLVFFLGLSLISPSLSWSWTCDSKTHDCKRIQDESSDSNYGSLEVCQMICNEVSPIWPQPQQITLNRDLVQFSSEIIFTNKAGTNTQAYWFLQHAITYFNNNLRYDQIRNCMEKTNKVKVILEPLQENVDLNSDTDESYDLNLETENEETTVKIVAETVFGIRHGLESLLQLIVSYPTGNQQICLAIVREAGIHDYPFYKHRGLLVDSSRNFLSLKKLKQNIDAMAASKLNVLHWHITDSQSFPLELLTLPNMTLFGAYSPKQVYKRHQIEELYTYATLRGVRILPEIDGPAHAGSGWEWGPEAGLGNLAVCINKQPWRDYCLQPPCGQLNPSNQNLYPVLQKIFKELSSYDLKSNQFHMGGDEICMACWNTTQEILDYLKGKPRTEQTFLELWSEHQEKTLQAFDQAVGHSNSKIILWSSDLTQPSQILDFLSPTRYIIQTWVGNTDSLPQDLLEKGYNLIISTKNAWYLDHGFWGKTEYYTWQTVYNNQLPKNQGVLGGEVCMWGELVDDRNILPRVWPRAAAAAERLWSNPDSIASSTNVFSRFSLHRDRLVERGVACDAVLPQWCVQNEGDCK